MIFVTGPLFSGKRQAVMELLGWGEEELKVRAIWDVQELVKESTDLDALVEKLSACEVVIATEVGGGVVPVDRQERDDREAAGRLAVQLARRADTVIRVFCGIPTVLKGALQ